MKNRNEDKFGIIKEESHQFNSLDKAYNYVKSLKDKLKRKAAMEEFPVSTAMPEDRLRFIKYGISLMTKENLPFENINIIIKCRAVLWLVANGYTFLAIANFLKKEGFGDVTIQKVKDVELKGMELARRAIEKVKNSKTPILGG